MNNSIPIITSLLYHEGERNLYHFEMNGEIKTKKDLSSGQIKTYSLNFFSKEYDNRFREAAIKFLKDSNYNNHTLDIDYRLLKDQEILDVLKSKSYTFIRIIGDNYKLTKEDFLNLSFAETIIVDDCVDELKNEINN